MSSGKVNSGEALPGESVINIPLADIDFPASFNTRSTPTGFQAQKTEDGGDTEDEESNSYSKNFLSIALKGQDTPIIVRPNPNKDAKKRYSCVTGFTRGAIIAELSHTSLADAKLGGFDKSPLLGIKNPTIKAIVRKMSDAEADELNVRENTARLNPVAADLAWGVYRIKSRDPQRTDQSIADSIGVSQPYVSRLLSIMGNFEDKVLLHWRNVANEGGQPLDTHTMRALVKVDMKDRTKAYFDACKAKVDKEESGEKGQNRWIDTAIEKSKVMGTLLGALVREGHITCEADAADMIRTLVPLKRKGVTEAQWNRFSKACEKAYAAAVEDDTDEERAAKAAEEAEAKEAAKAAKVAANGKGAAAQA